MHRDMDIIRTILLAVANSNTPVSTVENVSPELFSAHAQWLKEAGLVMVALQPDDNRPAIKATIFRLTWAGCDFVDAIKDDTIWAKAKANIIKPAASWTFDILLDQLKLIIKDGLGMVS